MRRKISINVLISIQFFYHLLYLNNRTLYLFFSFRVRFYYVNCSRFIFFFCIQDSFLKIFDLRLINVVSINVQTGVRFEKSLASMDAWRHLANIRIARTTTSYFVHPLSVLFSVSPPRILVREERLSSRWFAFFGAFRGLEISARHL